MLEQAKREAILEAAVAIFSRQGFKKTSIEEIARAAGVAKGTVYLACESKEDLFYQACHRELRAWLSQVAQMIDPRARADELFGTVAQGGMAYLESHPLVRDLLAGDHHQLLPRWAARFEELREVGRANVAEILRLGIRQGRFRADLDVDQVAMLLQDMMLATFVLHRHDGLLADREALFRRMRAGMDLVLHGLLA